MRLEFQESGPVIYDGGPPGVLILLLKDGVCRTISGRWQPAFVTNDSGIHAAGHSGHRAYCRIGQPEWVRNSSGLDRRSSGVPLMQRLLED